MQRFIGARRWAWTLDGAGVTYVAGIRNGDVGVLLTDTRTSFGARGEKGFNFSLKTGLLFRGCVYAGCGYVEPMRRFITRFKRRLGTTGTWEAFTTFATSYTEHVPGLPFQLVLMSRHSGESRFYHYDSTKGEISEQPDGMTIGSGTEILDRYLQTLREERNEMFVAYLREHSAPPWFFGYFYCLALMEYVQGDKYTEANRYGVGGVFHFSYQDSQSEHRQHPAVYVIVRVMPETKTLLYTLYRVTFEEMALVIEDGTTRSHNISIDGAAWPRAASLDKRQRTELHDRLFQGAINQPFYNFFGAGFVDEARRGNWVIHINYGNDPHLLTRSSLDQEALKSFVAGIADGSLQKRLAESMGAFQQAVPADAPRSARHAAEPRRWRT